MANSASTGTGKVANIQSSTLDVSVLGGCTSGNPTVAVVKDSPTPMGYTFDLRNFP